MPGLNFLKNRPLFVSGKSKKNIFQLIESPSLLFQKSFGPEATASWVFSERLIRAKVSIERFHLELVQTGSNVPADMLGYGWHQTSLTGSVTRCGEILPFGLLFSDLVKKILNFICYLANIWVTLFLMVLANFLFSNLAKFCENFGEIWNKPSGHTAWQVTWVFKPYRA